MSGVTLTPYASHEHDHNEELRNHLNGKEPPEISARQKMLAACSGSLLTSLLVTPLDVVRVRLQAQDTSSPRIDSSRTLTALRFPLTLSSPSHLSHPLRELGVTACCREVFWVSSTNDLCLAAPSAPSPTSLMDNCMVEQTSRNRHFTGTWEGLVKIARYEGISSLYRGLSPTLLMSIPANVIYFTGYDALRYSPRSPLSKLHDNLAPLVAGAAARTIAATAIGPVELFRTRLQATSTVRTGSRTVTAFRETMNGVRSMVVRDGVTSLWRGLTLTLWRDVPFSGIYWLGYESVRSYLISRRPNAPSSSTIISSEATFTDSFTAGALSGGVSALITTPFDVGKTRRQVNTSSSNETMARVLYSIWAKEGLRGLFKGAVPRILKVAPACAIMISSYEVGKKAAGRVNERKERREQSRDRSLG